MVKSVIVKAGSETPDPITGMTYPIPKTLNQLRDIARIVVTEDENEQTLIKAVNGATVLLITYGQVSEAVIKAGVPTLKAVVKMGTGIDSIDFKAAKSHNVRVVNCPGYAKHAVAENAFMLMINVLKRYNMMRDAVQKSGWLGATEGTKGAELFGKTVGLIGFGHINTGFARMCMGFGMFAHAYDPYVDGSTMEALSVSKVNDLGALADTSDVVMICVPLNPETHHIIGAEFLDRMKPSAIVVNVGRGATIDEFALLEALENNAIAGCGLDVFSHEPLDVGAHPLKAMLSMPNVVISPHLAAWAIETWDRLQDEVTAHVHDVLAGRRLTIRSTDPRLAEQSGCVYERGDNS